jgi:hypothetical protein
MMLTAEKRNLLARENAVNVSKFVEDEKQRHMKSMTASVI